MCFALGMRSIEDLVWRLSKVVYNPYRGESFYGIIDGIDILSTLVGQMVEDIYCLNGSLAFLFASKDQINPVM